MKADAEAARSRKSIKTWESRLKDSVVEVDIRSEKLKQAKLNLKKNELELDEIETKIEKLELRRDSLKSEREVDAQNKELGKLKEAKDFLELAILEMFDVIDSSEAEFNKLKSELEESKITVASDVSSLNAKIEKFEAVSNENRESFEKLSESLSPQHRSRFLKLIKSKDGIAVAALNGEICSHCNFVIPSSIALSVKNGELHTCTNCGRFIY